MDFVLKDSVNKLNICRCCLAEGCNNDIHTEYYHSGQREVYEEMLNYTFDIQIPHTGSSGQLDKSCLICDNCVTILREACQFKRMIKRSLEAFAKILDQQTSSCNKEPIAQDRKSMVEDEFVRDEDLVDVDMRYDDRISHDDDDEESNGKVFYKFHKKNYFQLKLL
ncbi:hypothetical protein O0L34_g12006 [Tuta absoluta]|nr:hypothetical protein O0L34_g12006 [Tuta absoluta]